MTTIPKPKHCGQNWLDMNPTEGGRICGQCDKKIIDFSKKSWTEIEILQNQHNNGLCGMYNPKQLDNWGKEIPPSHNSLLKAVAITGITISFAASSYSQIIIAADSLVIEGKIIDGETGEGLPFAKVNLKSNKVEAITDLEGNFKLVLRNVSSNPIPDTLEISYVGLQKKELVFSNLKEINKKEEDELKITLASEEEISVFYVHAPSRAQKMKWKIKSWFKRKEE